MLASRTLRGWGVVFLISAGASATAFAVAGVLSIYHLGAGLVRSLFLPAFAAQRMTVPAVLDSGSRVLAMIGGIGGMLLGGDTLVKVLVGFPLFGVLLVTLALWQARRDLGGLRLDLHSKSVFAVAGRAWPVAAGQVVFRLHSRADV